MSNENHMDVAVLIPCYNEASTVGKVVDDFRLYLPEARIYVYDNNSTDETASIAETHGAIVRHEPRQGKGNVTRAMFCDIDADIYIMVDGDDTYPADQAPAMVQKIIDGYDMVIGDRLSSTYFTENKRPFHNFGNRLVRRAINWCFHANINDIMTGFRAFSFAYVKTFPILSTGFEIETEMTIQSLDKNLRLYEMPVKYRDRPHGSVSKLNTFGDGMRVLSTIFQMIRQYRPMSFFGSCGSILTVLGLGFLISVIIDFWRTGVVMRFPTLVCSVLLILMGLLGIFTGVILDILARNDRKSYIRNTNTFTYLRRREKSVEDVPKKEDTQKELVSKTEPIGRR